MDAAVFDDFDDDDDEGEGEEEDVDEEGCDDMLSRKDVHHRDGWPGKKTLP